MLPRTRSDYVPELRDNELLATAHRRAISNAVASSAASAPVERRCSLLGSEIPVRMMYHTAYVDDAGRLTLRPDSYGVEEKLGEELGLTPGIRRNFHLNGNDDVRP